MLWFDVGKKEETTDDTLDIANDKLWFDVGKKEETTLRLKANYSIMLWFDVGKKEETTHQQEPLEWYSCGLM